MKVTSLKIKLFGKVAKMFRVLSATGEVLQVFETEAEANDWMQKQ